MTCRVNEHMAVCGPSRRRRFYYFTSDFRQVLLCDSLWYEPRLVMARKKHARVDHFKDQARRKLGFLPQTYKNWWRRIALPRLRDIKENA